MIIPMQVIGRGSRVVMQDDGSGQLLMKTTQVSLRDGDKQSESTMTVCKVWLGWEARLLKFWEGQSGLLEGKVGMIYTFSKRTANRGKTVRFAQFSRGTSRAALRVSRQGLHSFLGNCARDW